MIENVFPVCVSNEDVGKKRHTFGTTKFYQLRIKFEGETEIFYNKEKITFSAGDVLYLPTLPSASVILQRYWKPSRVLVAETVSWDVLLPVAVAAAHFPLLLALNCHW